MNHADWFRDKNQMTTMTKTIYTHAPANAAEAREQAIDLAFDNIKRYRAKHNKDLVFIPDNIHYCLYDTGETIIVQNLDNITITGDKLKHVGITMDGWRNFEIAEGEYMKLRKYTNKWNIILEYNITTAEYNAIIRGKKIAGFINEL